jgi:hypothetical protein
MNVSVKMLVQLVTNENIAKGHYRHRELYMLVKIENPSKNNTTEREKAYLLFVNGSCCSRARDIYVHVLRGERLEFRLAELLCLRLQHFIKNWYCLSCKNRKRERASKSFTSIAQNHLVVYPRRRCNKKTTTTAAKW